MNKSEIQKLTVFLDMDSVLCDFDKFILEKLGRSLDSFPDSASGWAAINEYQDLYLHLDPMPDAHELVNGVQSLQRHYGFNVEILTAIPKIGRIPDARLHKAAWVDKHFPSLTSKFNIGPHAEHKQYHCRAGDVLIDGSERNIPQWNSRGGLGILHTSAKRSLYELETYCLSGF